MNKDKAAIAGDFSATCGSTVRMLPPHHAHLPLQMPLGGLYRPLRMHLWLLFSIPQQPPAWEVGGSEPPFRTGFWILLRVDRRYARDLTRKKVPVTVPCPQ